MLDLPVVVVIIATAIAPTGKENSKIDSQVKGQAGESNALLYTGTPHQTIKNLNPNCIWGEIKLQSVEQLTTAGLVKSVHLSVLSVLKCSGSGCRLRSCVKLAAGLLTQKS